jgi:hypothetical protein
MDNEKIQHLLNKVLYLNPLEKNNFYHTLLNIIKSNTDPKQSVADIIMEFDELLTNKRAKLDGLLNGNNDNTLEEKSTPGKISPIFRRVS